MYYKMYFTYDVETIGEDGERLYQEVKCVEHLRCLEDVEDLRKELQSNHCHDICWQAVQAEEETDNEKV